MHGPTFFSRRLARSELALAAIAMLGIATVSSAVLGADAPTDGNHILIADQFNNRVIEVDKRTNQVVWQFGDGSDVAGPHSVVGVNDAVRLGKLTLVSGTGIPPSNPPLPGCSDAVNGCPDNRVMLVDPEGRIVWQYGQAGVAGAGADQLNTPVAATQVARFMGMPGFQVMITDQANQRIIVVNMAHEIVWQYGTTGVAGKGRNQLNNPNSAELLANGHVLIADESNNRVIEVTTGMKIVQAFTIGGTLNGAAFASRLPNGDTLITDSGNNRAVEVDGNDAIVWQYVTNMQPNSNPNPAPTRAVRLRNGDTLISDQFNQRVIEVTPDKQIVFTQGKLNKPGMGFDRLNGPYDAKVIDDFTGLTPPLGFDQ
jgi:outer membrane protein assembly factor BamB